MYRLPMSALWIVVFAAVLGHLPSLGFDFAGPDFQQLAVGAGLSETPAFTPQVWTGLWRWNLWWRVSGADASVPHGAAVLVNPLETSSIAGGIETLVDQPDRREEMRRRGREVSKRYDWDVAAGATLESYRKALGV